VDYPGLLLRAGYNYHVFLASMFGYARDHGGTVAEFLRWTAEHVAGSWEALRGHGADAVMGLVLENLASTGYTVEQVELGPELSRAAVLTTPLGLTQEQWAELLTGFAVSPDEMAHVFDIFVPLARDADVVLEIDAAHGTTRLTARRLQSPPGPQPIRFFENP
jgi:hypothetical protein